MDILVKVALPISLAFIMFSLGLGLTVGDFTRVFKQPKAFSVGAFNQVLLLPVITFIIILFFEISDELAVGFMILSACPGGVTSNILSKLAKADVALSVSLTAVISLISAFSVPLIISLSISYFMGGKAIPLDVTEIALKMFVLTVVPIILGLAVSHFLPTLTIKVEPAISGLATILFVLVVVAAVVTNWQTVLDNITVLGPAVVVLNLTLLFTGFVIASLSGLSLHQAKTISIETGIQNSTLGITAASLLLASESGFSSYSLPAACYGILMYFIALPIIFWFRSSRFSNAPYSADMS